MARRGDEIITLAATGLTDKQIAEELKISVRTVESHWRRMREETGAPNRSGLIGLALNQRSAEQKMLFESKIAELERTVEEYTQLQGNPSCQNDDGKKGDERSRVLHDELNQLYQEVNELKARHIHAQVLNAIVLKSSVLAYRLDAKPPHKAVYVSDSVRQFGFKPSDFTEQGLPMSALTHPDDFLEAWGEAILKFENGERIIDRRYRIITKRGDIRWVFERCILELDDNENPESIAAFAFDVTHLGSHNNTGPSVASLQ